MAKGEDFFKDTTDDFSKGGYSSKRVSDGGGDRMEMIEEVYMEVLGRKPSSRELSYYKYSVSEKDDIVKKLLKSDEHKEIISKSIELPNVKEGLEISKLDNMKLNQKLEDVGKEIIELQGLLSSQREKITELRSQIVNPYELPSNPQKFEEGFDVYQNIRVREDKLEKKSFKEKLKDFILLMFE